jgi:hypothetical protein
LAPPHPAGGGGHTDHHGRNGQPTAHAPRLVPGAHTRWAKQVIGQMRPSWPRSRIVRCRMGRNGGASWLAVDLEGLSPFDDVRFRRSVRSAWMTGLGRKRNGGFQSPRG